MYVTKQLKLTLPLPQSVNHIYGRNKFGSTYLKAEGKEYKKKQGNYIREEVKKQGWEKLKDGEYCYLDEVIYMNKKGRDSDNLKKLTQDTITECGVVWEDDTYCLPRTNRVYIDSKNPREELVITPTKTVGIFNSKEDYELFLNNCKECKRYKKNCSILKSILENRIHNDVVIENNIWQCNKLNKI